MAWYLWLYLIVMITIITLGVFSCGYYWGIITERLNKGKQYTIFDKIIKYNPLGRIRRKLCKK